MIGKTLQIYSVFDFMFQLFSFCEIMLSLLQGVNKSFDKKNCSDIKLFNKCVKPVSY